MKLGWMKETSHFLTQFSCIHTTQRVFTMIFLGFSGFFVKVGKWHTSPPSSEHFQGDLNQTKIRLVPEQKENIPFSLTININPSLFACEIIIQQRNIFWIFLNQTKILIVISLFRLIWHQTKLCLVSNQSEKCNHNLNLVWLIKNRK